MPKKITMVPSQPQKQIIRIMGSCESRGRYIFYRHIDSGAFRRVDWLDGSSPPVGGPGSWRPYKSMSYGKLHGGVYYFKIVVS